MVRTAADTPADSGLGGKRMKCLRCGYCCKTLIVTIVDDPGKGIEEDNLKTVGANGPERCPHLRGDRPGSYACNVHNHDWFQDTPCAAYQSHWPEQECRMGAYIVKGIGRSAEAEKVIENVLREHGQ